MKSQRRGALKISLAAAAVILLHSGGSAQDADVRAGEKLFGQCKACHEVGEGAAHKVGPHLDGIIGRTAGTTPGFRFSNAMKQAGQDGLVWDAEALSDYIEKPRDFIPGNRMSYRGMASPEDRETLINWLSTASAMAPAEDPTKRDTATVPGFASAVLEMEGDPEYGEYLAGECVTCHQQSGRADGIPSIIGLPRDYFVRALFEYKSNVRQNDVMQLRVQNLTNEEIASLAAYFTGLQPN